MSGGVQGGGSTGEKGREAGGGRAGSGIPKVAGTGRKRVKFRNISLYFAIDMERTVENSYGKGWEAGVKGTEGGSKRYGRREVQTPLSPPLMISVLDEIKWSRFKPLPGSLVTVCSKRLGLSLPHTRATS